MADPRFIHLRLHSDYSLVDGIVRVKPLAKACVDMGMPAVGMTDESNLFALIKVYEACRDAGIKPIMGADLWLESVYLEQPFRVTALIHDVEGYHNLVLLVSRGWRTNQVDGRVLIKQEWLDEHQAGLIWLAGAKDSEIGQLLLMGRADSAAKLAAAWQTRCPERFYLEVMRTGRTGDEDCLHGCVDLADQLALPLVATNDVRFLEPEDFEAHEARVCIHDSTTLDDPRRAHRYSDQQYLKSEAEMLALFDDLPEATANTVEIAKRCTLELRLGKSFLPEFPTAPGIDINEHIRREARQGLAERLARVLDPAAPDMEARRKVYEDRLEFELGTIIQMRFPGYFLIVSDFIRWAKAQGIPVGPGRGSGAGSVVAWCLHITDLDPIKYDLLFERFLNPERVSMPDFDVDFCMDNRERVIGYVADKYGHDAVSQIVTFGTMAAKAVVRDVARVQGKSYGLADKISKMIPPTPGITLEQAVAEESGLHDFLFLQDSGNPDQEAANEIWEMALKLEGITRNIGKHAGGVVIAPGQLTDFAPVACDPDGSGLVTQYDKHDVEEAGLVKFDFLGLKTLTLIDWAMQAINRRRNKEGKPALATEDIPLDDAATFELLKSGNTTAVFQLESSGMRDLVKRLKPDVFEDIIALVALYRPGPLESGMVDNFIDRKHGKEALAYPDPHYQHDSLIPILKPTYGIILYQEQVMQIAQVLAGYTLGGADLLRRAMGKKKPEEMAKQRDVFREGAAKLGVDPELAMKIFDLVEKFAGYGFNKSHSAAYALVAYHTAWLKVHYPAEFMAAVISADMDNTDKAVVFINECQEMGLTVRPPEVNECEHHFTVNAQGHIVFGLGAIKGLGEGPIQAIVSARQAGPFTDLFDFCRRTDARQLNARSLEALIRAGALDGLGPHRHFSDRATLTASLDAATRAAAQEAENSAAGMGDLFGGDEVQGGAIAVNWNSSRPWRDDMRLRGERETLGLYLTGHPIDQFDQEIGCFISSRLNQLAPTGKNAQAVIAGLVIQARSMRSKRNNEEMVFLTLDDRRGRVEVSVFSRVLAGYRQLISKDELLVVIGSVRLDDRTETMKVVADELLTIGGARARFARRLHVDAAISTDLKVRLRSALQPWKGGACPVVITLANGKAYFDMELGRDWRVDPGEGLLDQLRQEFGPEQVQVQY